MLYFFESQSAPSSLKNVLKIRSTKGSQMRENGDRKRNSTSTISTLKPAQDSKFTMGVQFTITRVCRMNWCMNKNNWISIHSQRCFSFLSEELQFAIIKQRRDYSLVLNERPMFLFHFLVLDQINTLTKGVVQHWVCSVHCTPKFLFRINKEF